jgi:hypothetical protein
VNSALENAQKERDKLWLNYRKKKREQMDELYGHPQYGHSLRRFVATLGHFQLEHSARFVSFVEDECRRWLRAAPADIRFGALQAVDDRIQMIRFRAGLHPIDDGLPHEGPNVWQKCKEAISP